MGAGIVIALVITVVNFVILYVLEVRLAVIKEVVDDLQIQKQDIGFNKDSITSLEKKVSALEEAGKEEEEEKVEEKLVEIK